MEFSSIVSYTSVLCKPSNVNCTSRGYPSVCQIYLTHLLLDSQSSRSSNPTPSPKRFFLSSAFILDIDNIINKFLFPRHTPLCRRGASPRRPLLALCAGSGYVVFGVDFEEVVQHDHHHGAGAEEDGETVEVVVGDHLEDAVV